MTLREDLIAKAAAGQQPEPQFHPCCAFFPEMSKEEFADLVEDIREHGLVEPILRYRGQIIDGKNRYRACIAAGVTPRFEEFEPQGFSNEPADVEAEIWARAGSLNLNRRSLKPGQRVKLALGLKTKASPNYASPDGKIASSNGQDGQPASNAPKRGRPSGGIIDGQQATAKQAKASLRTVQRTEFVEKKGVAELQDLVREGGVGVEPAAKIASHPGDVQRFAVAKIREGHSAREALELARIDEHERKKPPTVDGRGVRVPDEYKAVFAEAHIFETLARQVSNIRSTADSLREKPHGMAMHYSEIMGTLKSAARALRGSAPYAVCVYCKGTRKDGADACGGCRGRGWTTKSVFSSAPPEMKAAAGGRQLADSAPARLTPD
jgi:hypothetical protein